MPKFYIQSGYQGKEVSAVSLNYEKQDLKYSAIDEYAGEPIIGSVEFVEQYIGQRTPNHYPEFLSSYFYRNIEFSNDLPNKTCFVKPADRHKRFDSYIFKYPRRSGGCGWCCEKHNGPFWCSEIVSFKEEWRYYVAQGKVMAAYWYQGEEIEINPPKLSIDWPEDFCGAVDFGRLQDGRLALVENNLPYACGWYGPYSEGKIYGEWLQNSWGSLFNL
jgi:hypothetical protein